MAASGGDDLEAAFAYLQIPEGEPAGDEAVAQQSVTIARYARDRRIEIVGEFRDLKADVESESRHRHGLYDLMIEAAQTGSVVF